VNLRTLDLNLLVILDALLDEGHVSRAAERLGLSQPATSAALERCRGIFGDPLLERRGGGMKLTAKAEALRDPLRAVLGGVIGLVDPAEPDLTSIDQVVRLIMTDYPAVVLARTLLPKLRATGPGINLVVLPWHGGGDAAERLRHRRIGHPVRRQRHPTFAVAVRNLPHCHARRSSRCRRVRLGIMAGLSVCRGVGTWRAAHTAR
jgi:DNA-binding transcriptional LysR family regulator